MILTFVQYEKRQMLFSDVVAHVMQTRPSFLVCFKFACAFCFSSV